VYPSQNRKAQKAATQARQGNSFKVVAREWWQKHSPNWAASHSKTVIRRLEKDIFPYLGGMPIAEIGAPELLSVVRKVEARGALETAHRKLNICSMVFCYAVATRRADRDPSTDLRRALPLVKTQHLASVTDPQRMGQILRMIDSFDGGLIVSRALRLALFVFVRLGELRHAKWEDIDFEGAEWRFVASKTKSDYIVPLSRQAISILKEGQPLTGQRLWVFPSARSFDRPISENAILAALRVIGIPKQELCGHGSEAMARTLLDEQLGVRPDLIEHQLAHAVRDPHGRA
jgi:integrase